MIRSINIELSHFGRESRYFGDSQIGVIQVMLTGVFQNRIIDVRDVSHERYLATPVSESTDEKIVRQIHHRVADMRRGVGSNSAYVHAEMHGIRDLSSSPVAVLNNRMSPILAESLNRPLVLRARQTIDSRS